MALSETFCTLKSATLIADRPAKIGNGLGYRSVKRVFTFFRSCTLWSIPKGELEPDEDFLEAALRECKEEVGVAPAGSFIALTPIKQKGGKIVHAWAFEGDCNPSECVSNMFTMEWPPKSGRQVEFPESDRADFFDVDSAKRKIKDRQVPLIEELETILNQ